MLEKHADFLRDFRGDTVHASTLTAAGRARSGGAVRRAAATAGSSADRSISAARCSPSPTCAGCRARTSTSPWSRSGTSSSCWPTRPAGADVHPAPQRRGDPAGCASRGGWSASATATGHGGRARAAGRSGGRPATAGDSTVRAAAGLAPAHVRGSDRRASGSGCRGRATTRPGVGGWVGDAAADDHDRPGRLLAVRLRHRQGQPTRRCGRRGSPRSGRGSPTLVPWLADRVEALASFDDVKLLNVRLEPAAALVRRRAAADRRRRPRHVPGRWGRHQSRRPGRGRRRPGSSGRCLRAGSAVTTAHLRAVQRRRAWPAAVIQSFQRVAHAGLAGPRAARADPPPPGRPVRRPRRCRCGCWTGMPVLQGIPARAIAIGPLPEHAPKWARRP